MSSQHILLLTISIGYDVNDSIQETLAKELGRRSEWGDYLWNERIADSWGQRGGEGRGLWTRPRVRGNVVSKYIWVYQTTKFLKETQAKKSGPQEQSE